MIPLHLTGSDEHVGPQGREVQTDLSLVVAGVSICDIVSDGDVAFLRREEGLRTRQGNVVI